MSGRAAKAVERGWEQHSRGGTGLAAREPAHLTVPSALSSMFLMPLFMRISPPRAAAAAGGEREEGGGD